MPSTKPKKPKSFDFPEIEPGVWRGSRFGTCAVNFGQVVQPGPPRQSVEFSYLIFPLELKMPVSGFILPGVTMIMAPTPMKTEFPEAGELFRTDRSPVVHLNLEVTRSQFSDMLFLLKERHLNEFHFTVEETIDEAWPIHSWGVGVDIT